MAIYTIEHFDAHVEKAGCFHLSAPACMSQVARDKEHLACSNQCRVHEGGGPPVCPQSFSDSAAAVIPPDGVSGSGRKSLWSQMFFNRREFSQLFQRFFQTDICEFEFSQPRQAIVSSHHLRFSFRLAHSALSGGQPAPLFAGEPSGMDGAQQGNDSCQACTTKRSSSTV
jgi:hypothetical protein